MLPHDTRRHQADTCPELRRRLSEDTENYQKKQGTTTLIVKIITRAWLGRFACLSCDGRSPHCTSKCITTRCAPSYDYTLGAFLCCYFLRPTLGLARSRAALCRTTALDRQQAIAFLANEFSLLPLPAAVAGGAAGQWRGNQDSKVESESQAVPRVPMERHDGPAAVPPDCCVVLGLVRSRAALCRTTALVSRGG